MKKHKVTLKMDEISGYLRHGHFELELDDEEMAEFELLDKEQQVEWITDAGSQEVDDYDIEDWSAGDWHDVEIERIGEEKQ